MQCSATFSLCNKYRYELRRVWDKSKPLVMFIGLNPSRADADLEDNTSRICINYAKRWEYGGLILANLFAYRSTYQSDLFLASEPVGHDNNKWIKTLKNEVDIIVCAWGDSGGYKHRDEEVLDILENPYCLSKLKSGRPGHPLYKSKDLVPIKLI
jgi:hypothetical protein